MLKYIIRLDDACPTMNEKKWNEIEKLLDKYNIKPIVGVIPDNKDKEFKNPEIKDFWKKYPQKWQKKGWIIAQHGLNHDLSKKIRTEFKGKTYEEQKEILKQGNKILKQNGVKPKCFFAPAHTFDNNTILACKELGYFDFISDGYAFYPYKYKDMLFLPSVFDTPHKISKFGIFTFIYHPNNTSNNDLAYLEEFIKNNKEKFETDINSILKKYSNRKRNIVDFILQMSITLFRVMRKIIKE